MTDNGRTEAPAIERDHREYDPQAQCHRTRVGHGKERDRLSQIIDGSPVPTFVIDENHLVTHWNRACEAIFSVPAATIIGTQRQRQIFYGARQALSRRPDRGSRRGGGIRALLWRQIP